ncbi:hypothetical protein J7F01_34775 [Streptomyces sp. ISL-22]|uniref:hypothetical protein n=1 Tax=unclassified Streptomyces TaxID=2593676 RepID=UPI001BEC7C11|nr:MULTISPECIES: hypothetical protein [unclassified Streptomyces]MBT2417584.1 hypothetical protein [Streptomyces sp. ISL-24]MBT2437235.1 hypothetical protein [Streptomyces sp. ISL-22]
MTYAASAEAVVMAKGVVVHGLGKQYLGPHTLHGGGAPALLDGLRAADAPALRLDDVEVAFCLQLPPA